MATENHFLYTALHAFAFVDHVPHDLNVADVVDELRDAEFEHGQVLFASVFVGAFVAVVHLRTEGDLPGLQRFIFHELHRRGLRCEHAVEGAVYTRGAPPQPMGPKRGSPPYCALVRVRAAGDPKAVMSEIGRRFRSSDPFRGASIIFGTADILVELGGDSLDAVSQPVLDVVRGTPGILHTDVSFAFTDPWRGQS